MLQELAGLREAVVLQGVGPEGVRVDMPRGQQCGDLVKHGRVMHPPGDPIEVESRDVVGSDIFQHLLGGAKLREVLPRTRIDLAGLVDDMADEGRGKRDQFFLAGDLNREVGKVTCGREVEVVVERLGVIRFQSHQGGAGWSSIQNRDGPLRHLQQQAQGLAGGVGIGDHHLAPVNGVHEEFFGNVLVNLLPIDHLMPVAVTKVGLPDEYASGGFAKIGPPELLVEHNRRTTGGQGELGSLDRNFVFRRVKREIEDCQGQQHLCESACRLGDIPRQEWLGWIVLSVVPPERIDPDQGCILLLDEEVVVVVLGPFSSRLGLSVESPKLLHAEIGEIGIEELRVGSRGVVGGLIFGIAQCGTSPPFGQSLALFFGELVHGAVRISIAIAARVLGGTFCGPSLPLPGRLSFFTHFPGRWRRWSTRRSGQCSTEATHASATAHRSRRAQ